MAQKVAIGSDHAGFEAKEEVKKYLTDEGIDFEDFGTFSKDSCDYPDYARKVAEAVSKGQCLRGVLCCGSGIGVAIVANKVRGIRAALCHEAETAKLSRQHNDSNVICFAGRTTPTEKIREMLEVWFATDFEGGRHKTRVDKIEKPRAGETLEASAHEGETQSWYSIH
ncbi:MAG: ribose 5-phosphate isomerase B [Candidatus Obscuribacterales bacterium]|nr:ribose 5-phosphate isomerase B [Candidatus Obscuribacterales bacterium]